MASLIYGVKEAGPTNGKPIFTIDRILGLDKKEHWKIKPYRPWAGSPVNNLNKLVLSAAFCVYIMLTFVLFQILNRHRGASCLNPLTH